MRGRRRTLASVLAEALAARPGAEQAAVAAAFADACGPRLAREAAFRGTLADGRLLILVRGPSWAAQVEALGPVLCAHVNARLGRKVATGLWVRVAPER